MVVYCGSVCRPTRVEREIRAFQSSTSPFHVVTDEGPGFVKGINNPYNGPALTAELVAAELGTWFGLNVPPFAIVPECDIELVMKNGQAMQGPLFFSSEVDGTPHDGSDLFLSKLHDKEDIAKLVVFDTWVLNWDRHGAGDANPENLLFVRRANGRKYDMVPIDHAWAFDANFPVALPTDDTVEDNSIYGRFPEFDPYINHDTVSRALDRLRSLDRAFVQEVVNSVPPQWGLGDGARASLLELICRRAAFVVNTVEARLVDDPPLPGVV